MSFHLKGLSQWARNAEEGEARWIEVPQGEPSQTVASRVKSVQGRVGRTMRVETFLAVPQNATRTEVFQIVRVTALGPKPAPKKRPGRKPKARRTVKGSTGK